MRMLNKIKRIRLSLLAPAIMLLTSPVLTTCADSEVSFGLSPMKQSIVLNPGDTYHGSFKIVNPNSSKNELEYEIERKSFYVDEGYGTTFDEIASPIVDWTTLNSDATGIVAPNSNVDIKFTIEVPEDAASGGQYEAFMVKTKKSDVGDGNMQNGAGIQEQLIMAHLVFAEIAGNTVRQGEIVSVDVPSFLLSGNITGSAAIKNTGNIHGEAKYIMQVYPLFSSEEAYTNEEDPDTRIILPDRTLYNELAWSETPDMGIFNVIYTVEFEGVTTQVSKLVIKCPIWLLFIIIFIIFAIIIWIVMRVKHHGKKSRKTTESNKSTPVSE